MKGPLFILLVTTICQIPSASTDVCHAKHFQHVSGVEQDDYLIYGLTQVDIIYEILQSQVILLKPRFPEIIFLLYDYSLLSSLPYATCSHSSVNSLSLEPDLSFMDTVYKVRFIPIKQYIYIYTQTKSVRTYYANTSKGRRNIWLNSMAVDDNVMIYTETDRTVQPRITRLFGMNVSLNKESHCIFKTNYAFDVGLIRKSTLMKLKENLLPKFGEILLINVVYIYRKIFGRFVVKLIWYSNILDEIKFEKTHRRTTEHSLILLYYKLVQLHLKSIFPSSFNIQQKDLCLLTEHYHFLFPKVSSSSTARVFRFMRVFALVDAYNEIAVDKVPENSLFCHLHIDDIAEKCPAKILVLT
uniref:Secreted protein n=1 Tax=Heterorhabditis bacteriophora TaxID=37862 RepID=A0A1I7X9U5_HETBA